VPGTLDSPRALWRIAVPAYGPTALSSVGTGAVLPVLALTARELGASVGVAALVVAALGIGTLLAALPAGSLVAAVGERRGLVVAGLVEAVAMLVALVAGQVWQLLAAVVVIGAASAVFGLARQAYLTDAVPVHLRARALSTLGGVHRIGVFVGPLLGAGIIGTLGLRAVYAFAAVMALAGVVLVLVTRDLTAEHRAARAHLPRPRLRAVLVDHRRVLLTLGTGIMALAAARATRMSILPLWAEAIGLDAARTSLVFAVAGGVEMLLFYPAGAVMDRFGRVWTAVPAIVLLATGMLVLPLTGDLAGLTTVAVLMAVGNGLGSGIIMTLGADASPEVGRAQFLGGWRLFAEVGASGGPLLISALAGLASLVAASLVMGGITLAGGAWLARWVPRYDPRARSRRRA
jgi:MFS family permease